MSELLSHALTKTICGNDLFGNTDVNLLKGLTTQQSSDKFTVITTGVLDVGNYNIFQINLTSAITFSTTGTIKAGDMFIVDILMTGADAFPPVYMPNITWHKGTEPVPASTLHVLLYTVDAGLNWFGKEVLSV